METICIVNVSRTCIKLSCDLHAVSVSVLKKVYFVSKRALWLNSRVIRIP
jgi:hypothetical protein